MDKQKIGKELKERLLRGYDVVSISRWASRVSFNIEHLDYDLRDILETLYCMETDNQFELSEEELTQLANRLIEEGERENLEKSYPEIKETAVPIVDNWLMCPACQEAWESVLDYRIICCPKCQKNIHNPKFKSDK